MNQATQVVLIASATLINPKCSSISSNNSSTGGISSNESCNTSSINKKIRLFTSQKWVDTSYQTFHWSKVAGPKLSDFSLVKSGWTQVIRLFTSQKWLDPSYQAFHWSIVTGPMLSDFSPVKSGWTQVIRLLIS